MNGPLPGNGPKRRKQRHVLSFDVEEYFQVESARRAGITAEHWDRFERRLEPQVELLLELLAEARVRATFFVLGWVARNQPGLVRRISQAGHEIASHGLTHRMLTNITVQQFRSELADSRKLLEDLTGECVAGYRAATFSITRSTAWAFDVLAEAQYRYDSSVYPVRHDRYGVPDAPRWAHIAVGPAGGSVLEIPPLTVRLLGVNLPVGGGGYLRLLPYPLLGRAVRSAQRKGQAAMIYLHPWELDPAQPVMAMPATLRWRHRVNLDKTAGKLRRLLADFDFTCAMDLLEGIDINELPRFAYA